jgi:hypothetical protein
MRYQTTILRQSAKAAEEASIATKVNAQALINSERAWLVVELVPLAARYDNRWHRIESYGPVAMSMEEILAGHHLRYKLRITNMGRTPAQVLGFEVEYSCLPKGAPFLYQGSTKSEGSYRPFDQLLGGGGEFVDVEEPLVDLEEYMKSDIEAIRTLEKTAVLHGAVRYRHMFSTNEDCISEYCYVFTVSTERLSKVARPAEIGPA